MGEYLWPGDRGWPTTEGDEPDEVIDLADPTGEIDLDVLSLHAPPPHLWDDLTPTERAVVAAHYGLDGQPPRVMSVVDLELGLTPAQGKRVLRSALTKLRGRLTI